MSRHHWITGAAGTGLLASVTGGTVSLASVVGLTPAPVFASVSAWTPQLFPWGVPWELAVAVWFAAVLGIYGSGAIRWSLSASALVCVSAIPVSGSLGLFLVTQYRPTPLVLAASAAVAVLVLSASDSEKWPKQFGVALLSDLRALVSNSRSRTAVLAALAVVVTGGVWLHAVTQNVDQEAAFAKNVRRWYGNRATQGTLEPELRPSEGVRVVAFTAHQWNFLGNTLPDRVRQLETFRRAGLPIELVVRDFPLDPSCNPAVTVDLNQAACEAAFAVRYFKEVGGAAAARELASWLEARASVQSAELIRDRLGQLGLWEGFQAHRGTLRRLVESDITMGIRHGVSTAPTFFINGVRVPSSERTFAVILSLELEQWTSRQSREGG